MKICYIKCSRSCMLEAGLKYLATVHQAATEMSVENAVIGAIIPIQKDYKFWQEKGREIRETAQPIRIIFNWETTGFLEKTRLLLN